MKFVCPDLHSTVLTSCDDMKMHVCPCSHGNAGCKNNENVFRVPSPQILQRTFTFGTVCIGLWGLSWLPAVEEKHGGLPSHSHHVRVETAQVFAEAQAAGQGAVHAYMLMCQKSGSPR